MIKANAHKYPVSAMCRVLLVNRSTYYYEAKQLPDESGLASEIKEIFRKSRNNYGTRKIKRELMKTGKQVSRRRIGRIRDGLHRGGQLWGCLQTAELSSRERLNIRLRMSKLLIGQSKRKPEVNPLAALLPYISPVLSPL